MHDFDNLQSRLDVVLERAKHLTMVTERIRASIGDVHDLPSDAKVINEVPREEYVNNVSQSITDDFTSIRDDSNAIAAQVSNIDLDAILDSLNLGDNGLSL